MNKIIKKIKENVKGFTLIELIVVIALLSTVGTIVTVNTVSIKKKDNSKALKKCETVLQNCAEIYLSKSPDTGCISIEDLKKSGCYEEVEACKNIENKYLVKTDGIISLSDTKPNGMCSVEGSKYKLEIVSNYKDVAKLSDKIKEVAKESNQFHETTHDYNGTYSNSSAGIYKTSDDKGSTYYVHGNYTNNYVSFAGLTWRIVRINGDGTIRLILDDTIGKYKFYNTYETTQSEVQKYAGYTYNNSHKCTKSNPCKTTDGTSSDIKITLENWYEENIYNKGFDSYVAETNYCNDTSKTMSNYQELYYDKKSKHTKKYLFFGAADRQINTTFKLTCPNPSDYYGGNYKLKIGLISADESFYAGDGKSFLYTAGYLQEGSLTMTPKFITTDSGKYGLYFQYVGAYTWYGNCNNKYYIPSTEYTTYRNDTYWGNTLCDTSVNSARNIFPVINLKANTLASGNGHKEDPFVIVDSAPASKRETLSFFPSEKENIKVNFETKYYKDMTCINSANGNEVTYSYNNGILSLDEEVNTTCNINYTSMIHYIYLDNWYGPNGVHEFINDATIIGGEVEYVGTSDGYHNGLKVLINDPDFELNIIVSLHGEESEGSQLWSYEPVDYDIGVFEETSAGYTSSGYNSGYNSEEYLIQFKGISSSYRNYQETRITTEHYVSGYDSSGHECYTCTGWKDDQCISWSYAGMC